MAQRIPDKTIQAFARTIHQESARYGFSRVDTIRLINALMDLSANGALVASSEVESATSWSSSVDRSEFGAKEFPLSAPRLRIRQARSASDKALLEDWLKDEYGGHFLLSCATAQQHDIETLLGNPSNATGIIELNDGMPIGAVAYLDIDPHQQRAELRKLIGVPHARGQGFAEEATALWIEYGKSQLNLEKIYVSTLQTHLRNIKLNESVGFRVEGVLREEIRIGSERFDVLRMGLCES